MEKQSSDTLVHVGSVLRMTKVVLSKMNTGAKGRLRAMAAGWFMITLLVVLVATAGQTLAGTVNVRMVDLGTLGGTDSNAVAINDSGQVVGSITTADGKTHPFSWTEAGGMIDLGTLGGASAGAGAVNASGQVIGDSETIDGVPRAFSWTKEDGMINLGTLDGIEYSHTAGVNDSGQVIGTCYSTGGSVQRAFLWTKTGGMIDLGALRYASVAVAINNNGQVAGWGPQWRPTGGADMHPFLWTAEDGMIDLGELSPLAVNTFARGMNALGQIVGWGTVNSSYHGFSWTAAGGMIDLGEGGAENVNDSGQVIGWGGTASGSFLWTEAGGMIDLGTLGGGSTGLSAINASGQVVGSSTTASGEKHAFSWTEAGGMIDLGTLGGSNSGATGVNARGQVVGWSQIPGDAAMHAVLWVINSYYTFSGFFPPVDPFPTVNIAKAGQTIPVKWRIVDFTGAGISDQSSFTSLNSYAVACDNFSGLSDTVEEYVAGSSGLQYLGDGNWQYNWKTQKDYSNQCRTIVVTLQDGSKHYANFKFTR